MPNAIAAPAPVVPPPSKGLSSSEFLMTVLIVLAGAGTMAMGIVTKDQNLQARGGDILVKLGGLYVGARTVLKFVPQITTWLGYAKMALPFLPASVSAPAGVVLADVQMVLNALNVAQASPAGAPLPPGAQAAAAALAAAVSAPVAAPGTALAPSGA